MSRDFVSAFGLLMLVAVVAVIVSQRAQSSKVIQAIGTATGGVIQAATAPLGTGGNPTTGGGP